MLMIFSLVIKHYIYIIIYQRLHLSHSLQQQMIKEKKIELIDIFIV